MVDVDAGFYVRFADLFQIEGTAGRHAKARQKGAKANAGARSCALTVCRQAALPHCGPSTTAQQLAATEQHKQTNTAIPSATTGAMSATLEPGRRS